MANEKLVATIKNCARCGETHPNLEFEKLARAFISDTETYQYWAMCPKLREPVLLAVLDN